MKNDPVIWLDTDHMKRPQAGETIMENRLNFYHAVQSDANFAASVCVMAYGRLEKTKRCVESILKYTKQVNVELILIDNGSEESDVFEYFQTVGYPYKKIIKITKNLGFIFAQKAAIEVFQSEFFVMVPNDVVVTSNWLSNLLICIESDPTIGFVAPVSSNVSNLQQVDLPFTNEEEMQRQAVRYNISDPLKWEERLRLVTVIMVLRKAMIDNVGFFDAGFFHDFSEDDYAARVRRAGYKMMLCGDTWVHHDHDFRNMEDKDPEKFQQSLEAGRRNYQEKYYGLDAWDDINNFELGLISMLRVPKTSRQGDWRLLGIDTRCGTPILQIRNHLRKNGFSQPVTSYGFTTEAKYYQDLLHVTDGHVVCDRSHYLSEHYPMESMDSIILGEPINQYPSPISLMQVIMSLLKKGGKALIKLRNTADVIMFLNVIGMNRSLDAQMPANISLQDFLDCLKAIGVAKVDIRSEARNIDQGTLAEIKQALKKTGLCQNVEKAVQNICVKEYLLCVEK